MSSLCVSWASRLVTIKTIARQKVTIAVIFFLLIVFSPYSDV